MAVSLALIIVLGLTADYLFRRMRLPGLVGMLLVGLVSGPYVLGLVGPEIMTVSGDFRQIALIVILLRAGLELRRDTLHRVGRAAIIMSVVPALLEIVGVMLVAPRWLDITRLEAALLGAILAAVSPAVVVPLMIEFMDRGRGARKGIPTLVLGANGFFMSWPISPKRPSKSPSALYPWPPASGPVRSFWPWLSCPSF